MATNIIVIGALGKMGREICACILDDESVKLTGSVEYRGNPEMFRDIGDSMGRGTAGIKVSDDVIVIAR